MSVKSVSSKGLLSDSSEEPSLESSKCLFLLFDGEGEDDVSVTLLPSRQCSKLSLILVWLRIFSISWDDSDVELSSFWYSFDDSKSSG